MEAQVVLKKLRQTVAKKRDETILHVRGRINGQIEIAVARSYSHMIRGSLIPNPLRDRETYWDPESAIRLAG